MQEIQRVESSENRHIVRSRKLQLFLIHLLVIFVFTVFFLYQAHDKKRSIAGYRREIVYLQEEQNRWCKTQPQQFWQVYQDGVISFKYPQEWIAGEQQTGGAQYFKKFNDQTGLFTITIHAVANYNQETGQPYNSLEEYSQMPSAMKILSIDGQKAVKVLPRAGSENENSIIFFAKDQSNIYELSLKVNINPQDDSVINTGLIGQADRFFNEIIETVTFLD